MAVLHAALILLTVLAILLLPALLILLSDWTRYSTAVAAPGAGAARPAKTCEPPASSCAGRGYARSGSWLAAPATPTDIEDQVIIVAFVGPPIEQIAADLRRLARQRTGLASRSTIWFTAVQRAYDDRLTLACRELEITEQLAELEGMDREIERVRIEGMLQLAGLTMRDAEVDQR